MRYNIGYNKYRFYMQLPAFKYSPNIVKMTILKQ
ncbi:hypothetical protein SAMN05421823_102274 [Catalinimonas alkaloidigena]|uniref:Uncharacterized protein n=1 Tax=Catalinimonas alkaloidigena TaxID=1075417 RepID=A0A1G9AG47_9BACT|nr:hypothetical protein SAMN05421823_102274 [Catalinimonas alkaloidigena]